ncbi:MAG: DUF3782 domain-containing protein [Desulfobacterales bacterium]|nr:DUF3782 domain-containing protein [Desulfobacterales bacterium]
MNIQENERNIQEIWGLFRETDRYLKEMSKEFDRTNKEIRQQFKETDKKINRLAGLFEGQWGKLIESLAEGGVLSIFQERGISVYEVHQRVRSHLNGRNMEIDLLLVNDTDVVVIKVKTTLKADHVEDFLERMKDFPKFFRRYKGLNIYGAVAALRIEQASDRFAEKQGLFVIKVGGDGLVKLLNSEGFRPKIFGES